MQTRRSFLGAITIGLAAIVAKFRPKQGTFKQVTIPPILTGSTNGSSLLGLLSKLKNEESACQHFNWWNKS